MRRVVLAWLVASCALCLPVAPAHAEPADSVTRDVARSLGVSGVEAYQSGSYALASSRLEKAYGLLRVPSLGLWSARALVKTNQLVAASNRYAEVLALALGEGDIAVQQQAQRDAALELEQLGARMPRLTVLVRAADQSGLALRLDGQPVAVTSVGKPLPVDPGKHRVEADLGGVTKWASATAELGETTSVTLDFGTSPSAAPPPPSTGTGLARVETPPPNLPPPPPGESSTRRTLGWVGIGAGGAGLVVGSVAGAFALQKHAALADSAACSNGTCSAEKRDDVRALDTLRTVSGAGFIAGGVLAAAGIVLLVTAPSQHGLEASVAPGRVSLAGRF